MDTILNGILQDSKHSPNVQKQLFRKLCHAADQQHEESVVLEILQIAGQTILSSKVVAHRNGCKEIFIAWAKSYRHIFHRYFTYSFCNDIFLENTFANTSEVVWMMTESLLILPRSNEKFLMLDLIRCNAIFFIRAYPYVEVVVEFCNLLSSHPSILSNEPNRQLAICIEIIKCMGRFVKPERGAVSTYVIMVQETAQYVYGYMDKHCPDFLYRCLSAIFNLLSLADSSGEPSPALCAIGDLIPERLIQTLVLQAVKDLQTNDESLIVAVERIIDWIGWPKSKQADVWVINFLKVLDCEHKHDMLIKITMNKVKQVFMFCSLPERMIALPVLSHLLLSFQDVPDAFHLIIRDVPAFVQKLKNDKTSRHFLEQFSMLIHVLMMHHEGFPELYDPVIRVLKDQPSPDSQYAAKLLHAHRWCGTDRLGLYGAALIAPRSETGKTGLLNLGNTCYMNSVIQALYMCDSFRRKLLSSQPSSSESLKVKLQYIFSFLAYSQRAAHNPSQFLKASRPPWFAAGEQQDCSEFLKHLLISLHENEKVTSKKSLSLVESVFGGQMVTTNKCLNCGKESDREELFTDIPLPLTDDEWKQQAKLSPRYTQSQSLSQSSDDVDRTTTTSLEGLLSRYMKPVRLEGENQYSCEKCRSKQDAQQSLYIKKAPQYLVITLLRFSYDVKNRVRSKVATDVSYPKVLFLPTSGKLVDDDRGTTQSLKKRWTKRRDKPKEDVMMYGLCSVIMHSGVSSDHGHYYTYARHSRPCSASNGGDLYEDKWYHFNDNLVTFASFKTFSSITERFTKDTAYVLIYRKNSLADKSHLEVEPTVRRDLREAVDLDNRKLLQEREEEDRNRRRKSRGTAQSARSWSWEGDDDDNPPPPGCNGSGASSFDVSANRFIY